MRFGNGLLSSTVSPENNAHDARLLAAMLVHGIESLLTFNVENFLRDDEIHVLDATAAAGPKP